jgi:hypothetical protein
MKKFAILALAALLVVAFTVPAAALENEFGGYWRTRFYQMGHFNGEKNDLGSQRLVDTRTRLYYTAKINDNLKLVNKFEMDAVWGESQYVAPSVYQAADSVGTPLDSYVVVSNPQKSLYGDPGADGVRVEVKNSYADFNVGPVNFTVGAQPYRLFRSFYIDNDASGAIARWPITEGAGIAASWLKAYEGGADGGNNSDVDSYTIAGWFYFNENMSIKPAISYARSSELDAVYSAATLGNAAVVGTFNPVLSTPPLGEFELVTYGIDFDMDFDNFGLWVTAFGQDGSVDAVGKDLDIKAWLAAIGGNVMLGPVDLHGQFFYTPGDDSATDSDIENVLASNASYYWAEILGYGIFDAAVPAGSPGDKIFNIWAANIGTTFKPMDKLSITADLWYAQRDEDIIYTNIYGLPQGEDKLGTELDVVVTYQLVEGLNLDLVGAYLWAGDAVSTDGNNDEDPYEFGARLSLSF